MEQSAVYRVADVDPLPLPVDNTLVEELGAIQVAVEFDRGEYEMAARWFLASIARSLARIECNMREGGF